MTITDESDLDLALAHLYVTEPGGEPGVNVTAISGLLDDGKADAFAGAAASLARRGIDYRFVWDAKAERGTRIHAICEAFLRGESVDVVEEEWGFVDAVEKFIVEHQPEVLELEQIAIGPGYGGRFDMIVRPQSGEHVGTVGLVDLKTGKQHPVEHALQLAAYRYAGGIAVYDEAGMFTGTRPLPPIDFAGCLYVREDGTYSLIEYPADEGVYAHFRHLLGIYEWTRSDAMASFTKGARK